MSQMLKVSIGLHTRSGPWGGGNAFAIALTQFLEQAGMYVTDDLSAPDLDIIMLMDPREQSLSASYNHHDIRRYLQYVNPRAIVIHRVNECDERKGTTGVNAQLREGNQIADYTVFVSAWLRDLHMSQGMQAEPNQVIHNGSDRLIFHADGHTPWDHQSPLKLVTHHWSGNWNKGFDIYQQLDQLLAQEPFKSRFRFAYIGNTPDDFTFHHSDYIRPLSGEPLADVLRQYHVYLTASLNDPGPNHQNEGGNCGLPFLYRPSGGLTEYCEDYGIAFTADDLPEKLLQMANEYDHWHTQIKHYPYTAQRMASAYRGLFEELVANRDAILARRDGIANSFWLSIVRKVNQWRR